MVFLEWSPVYNVGIAELDQQHQRLFSIANAFHDALPYGNKDSEIDRVLEELVHFAQKNFSHEEYLMLKTNYPEFESHKQRHAYLAGLLGKLVTNYHLGIPYVERQLLHFLKTSLIAHIVGADVLYGPHLRQNGIE